MEAFLTLVAGVSAVRLCDARSHGTNGSQRGRLKKNIEPTPGVDSTQMRPPWRSTIFWHVARPIPDPGYRSWPWMRWKIWKILACSSWLMPMPLSLMAKTTSCGSTRAVTRIAGARSSQNVRALPIPPICPAKESKHRMVIDKR